MASMETIMNRSKTTIVLAFVAAVCSFSCGAPQASNVAPPAYTAPYIVSGVIRLPYAEIAEPFLAYDDSKNNRSRVDYYNGIQSVIDKSSAQGFPYGVTYKVIPFTNGSIVNQKTCFQLNGQQGFNVPLTTVIPDLSGFKFVGERPCGKTVCNVFEEVITVGRKTSTYTFLAEKSNNSPVQYEMMGYDSLLGSHFDKYYVDYERFTPNAKFTEQDFLPPQGLRCGDFPGPGLSKEEKIKTNPIREFVHREDEHVTEAFLKFKKEHGKSYADDKEHHERHHIFRQNLRYIHSTNRAGKSFTVAVNHLADLSPQEMERMRGFRYSHAKRGGKTFDMKAMKTNGVPDQWDWRLIGAVTPVKDQAICGSCWSFGTTGTIEGANFLKTGKLVRLSQSQLVDCAWGYGNNGCDGGEDFRAYKYIMEHGGLSTEEDYGPYLGIDSYCLTAKKTVQIENFTTIPQGDLAALKVSLFNKGPISVGIDASHKSFGFYSSGVYYEPACKSDPDSLDHAVLAVGYGVLDGQAYWLVKNSWSTYWGNDGYVLMSQKDNNCGVATDATYVEIKA